ncbi:MAG: metallophosphoesterase family protein [Verrucomicrobiota bacterium]
MKHGLVISDLHLFAGRSEAEALLPGIEAMMGDVEVVVLNGDIFDFAWSRYPSERDSLGAAQELLQGWIQLFRGKEISYVTGNHDCLFSFETVLDGLAARTEKFRWYRYGCRWGRALFLHGDCSNQRMSAALLARKRERWSRYHSRTRLHSAAYDACDHLRLTHAFHRAYFPREKTVARVSFHLDAVMPNWREVIENCYFGHTHVPFSGYETDGVRFHNTGSGIRGMGFQPMAFDLAEARGTAERLSYV